jgi:hypothetical protein
MDKHPDRLVPCANLINKFKDVSGKLLQKLTRFIHDMGTLGPVGVREIIRAINALKKELADMLESLMDCLGCDNFLNKNAPTAARTSSIQIGIRRT